MPLTRCWWCGTDPAYVAYHDDEWGQPVIDDVRLFEKLCLEAFQSGLSWRTILNKRENFRRAFHGFDFRRVACSPSTTRDRPATWSTRSVPWPPSSGGTSPIRHRGQDA